MLAMLEGFYRPQLERRGLASFTRVVTRATLVEMERLIFEHLRECPQCAPLLPAIRTAAALSAAWNSFSREPVPPGHLWMPEHDLEFRAATSAGMTAEEITVLVERAVRAATVANRKTVITKGSDGKITAETTIA